MQQMNCSSCGAALEVKNQFIRSLTCKFCGASYMVSGSDTLDPVGKTASLADYPSRLKVGAGGVIRGRTFSVIGRVRYAYAEGFWEEWQIVWDDGAPPDWLEEDEGYWTVYTRERVRGAVPGYDEVRVGQSVTINNRSVFITEKRTARMVGSEGQFSSVLPISGNFGYVQGSSSESPTSINYWTDEIELSVGSDLEHHEIKIQS
jgi:Domain of unknown function (DUF4178)